MFVYNFALVYKGIFRASSIHTLDFDGVGVSYTSLTVMDHADEFSAVSLFYLFYTLLKACATKQNS